MNLPALIGRIVHVGLGVFWAGTIFFMVFLLEPSVRSLGPEGGRVMQALQKRGFLTILPIAAVLTILSGGFRFWRRCRGSGTAWVHTPLGMALSIGGVASLVAFAHGFFVMRPATIRVGKLSALLGDTSDTAKRDALLAEIGELKSRSRTHVRWVAFWLGIAVVTMAVARYL